MPRFSSAASAITSNNSHVSTSSRGTLCCCVFSTPGSYSFTVPCYRGSGIGLGWPAFFISVVGGGGGGSSGASCGYTSGITNGYAGCPGGASCFGPSIIAYGGGGGLLPKTNCCAAGVANWGCAEISQCSFRSFSAPFVSAPYQSATCICCAIGGTGTAVLTAVNGYCCGGAGGNTCLYSSTCVGLSCYINCAGTGYSTTWCSNSAAGYQCMIFLSAPTSATPCPGGGGFGGFGRGVIDGTWYPNTVTGCGQCGTNQWTSAYIFGGQGGGGGCAYTCAAVGVLTPGATCSVVVGGGGSGGSGWPAINVCELVCCCTCSLLLAWGGWPRNYSCGSSGCNGYVAICYYC